MARVVGTIDHYVHFTLHNLPLQAHMQPGSNHEGANPRQEA